MILQSKSLCNRRTLQNNDDECFKRLGSVRILRLELLDRRLDRRKGLKRYEPCEAPESAQQGQRVLLMMMSRIGYHECHERMLPQVAMLFIEGTSL